MFKNPNGGTIQYTNVNTAYTGDSASWGASHQYDFSFVNCQGTITTKWVWVPDKIPGTQTDDALDTPPDWVIVHEQSEASYSGWFFLSGMGIGECDNDLGFDADETFDPMYMQGEEPFQIGYTFSGIAKGTRYKKRSGGAEITITCSPFASVAVVDGMCSAKVSYGVQIINPRVDVVGATDFPSAAAPTSPRAIKFITGQQISCTVSLVRSTGNQLYEETMLGVKPNSCTWSFSNGEAWDPFKEFLHGSTGQRNNLSTTELTANQLNFFSNKGAAGKIICTFKTTSPLGARLEDGLPDIVAKSKTMDSVRPAFAGWNVADGQVSVAYQPGQSVPYQFEYGGPGQDWFDIGFTVGGGFGQVGKGAICQLITAKRHVYGTYQFNGSSVEFRNENYNVACRDVNFPYPYNGEWTLPALGTGSDTPSQFLSVTGYTGINWNKATAQDTFKTWAMYRPPAVGTQPTTWIPIASYTWRWQGIATLIQGTWQLSNASAASDGIDEQEVAHPAWTLTSSFPINFQIHNR